MKKLLVLLLILSLTTLCACKNSVVDDLPDDVIDSPDASQNEQAGSSNEEKIDWETPIDIDDSFSEETEGEIDTTEGDDTEPSTDAPTNIETKPTNPSTPTQPTPTEPSPTQPAPTDPVETTRPGSSGPIELPMIPG